ncbi:MAG: alpha/beta hydrolase, partial [Bacteroidota bacterium]
MSRTNFYLVFMAFTAIASTGNAQEIVSLPFEEVKGVTYTTPERQFMSPAWQTTAVTNVSEPTLMVYRPTADKRNGTSLIVAPGGGLFGLSINSEGIDVANWLVTKGVTVFVLKYRLVPTGEDGTQELNGIAGDELMRRVEQVMPYSVQDGLNAVAHVRENAEQYGIDPNKIGFMGFSAGGAVTMGVAYEYNPANRPNYLVPVYAWTGVMPVQTPPDDAPPMLLICSTDDPLGLAGGSIDIYRSYLDNGHNAALHMYSQGGHGFGMRVQGLPSDRWIERFYEWAIVEQII